MSCIPASSVPGRKSAMRDDRLLEVRRLEPHEEVAHPPRFQLEHAEALAAGEQFVAPRVVEPFELLERRSGGSRPLARMSASACSMSVSVFRPRKSILSSPSCSTVSQLNGRDVLAVPVERRGSVSGASAMTMPAVLVPAFRWHKPLSPRGGHTANPSTCPSNSSTWAIRPGDAERGDEMCASLLGRLGAMFDRVTSECGSSHHESPYQAPPSGRN